ncbi:hypothetical protein BKA70DRAFT_1228107 [Coprinopsis sp. MPI-PUGE-AT-0042]|nr:hypothetical protein BKA70DRAFT_1228107 [Coprinopsis sp. MPI-PUGE-AT-0042]
MNQNSDQRHQTSVQIYQNSDQIHWTDRQDTPRRIWNPDTRTPTRHIGQTDKIHQDGYGTQTPDLQTLDRQTRYTKMIWNPDTRSPDIGQTDKTHQDDLEPRHQIPRTLDPKTLKGRLRRIKNSEIDLSGEPDLQTRFTKETRTPTRYTRRLRHPEDQNIDQMNQENKISDPDTSELRPETLGNLYRYTRDTKGTRTPKPELPELPEIKTPKGGTWGIKNSDQRTQKNQISDVRSSR